MCNKTGANCCFECDRVGYCEDRCQEVGCPEYDSEMIAMLRSASYRKAQEKGVD
jgi:hypothetical protein